jgi:hypothetical protein
MYPYLQIIPNLFYVFFPVIEDNLMDCLDLVWFWSLKMIMVVAETMMHFKGIMLCFWECIWQLRWNFTTKHRWVCAWIIGITPQKTVNCHIELCENFRWQLCNSDFLILLAIVLERKDMYHRPLNSDEVHIKLEQGCLLKFVNN